MCDSFDIPFSDVPLSVQEVKRAVVGFFANNDTTAYMSFAKVSHMCISLALDGENDIYYLLDLLYRLPSI
jgi:hypothetical protein